MSDEFGQLLSEQKEVAISQGAVVSGPVSYTHLRAHETPR